MHHSHLRGADAKLDWADNELDTLDQTLKAWDGSYSTSSDFYAEANVVAMRVHMTPMPIEWGVRVGNIVHCYRSALDYLVSDLAVLNGNKPVEGSGGNQFPILSKQPTKRGKPVAFATKTKGVLAGLDPAHVTMIETLQPYRPENNLGGEGRNPLEVLADLSNTDKHRLLRTMTGRVRDGETVAYKLAVRQDIAEITDHEEFIGFGNYVNDGAVLAYAEIVPSGPNPQMYFDALLPMRPVFETGYPVLGDLLMIGMSVRNIIDWLRPVFDGGEPGERPALQPSS